MKKEISQSEEIRNLAGPKIREIRERKKLTQKLIIEELKKQGVDINASTLSKMENMRRSISDFELVAIARVLKVSVVELIGE